MIEQVLIQRGSGSGVMHTGVESRSLVDVPAYVGATGYAYAVLAEAYCSESPGETDVIVIASDPYAHAAVGAAD